MDELIQLYRDILDFSGLTADAEGYISVAKVNKPSVIGDKRLVLPLQDQLKDVRDKVVFHPMSENFLKSESEIIKRLRANINIVLNVVTTNVVMGLINLIASPQLHANLSPQQHELLLKVSGEVDQKLASTMASYIATNVSTKSDRMFVNIYVVRGGKIGDESYARLGVVNFPFYQDLKGDKVDKLRVKDKLPLEQLMEFIFPNLETKDSYSYGSNKRLAPFLEVLMMSAGNVASRLNELIDIYSDYIDTDAVGKFNMEWVDGIEQQERYTNLVKQIPPTVEPDVVESPMSVPVAPAVPVAPVMPALAPPPTPYGYPQSPAYGQGVPEVKYTKNGIDFRSSPMVSRMPPPAPPAPQYPYGAPPPQNYGYGQPQFGYGAPPPQPHMYSPAIPGTNI